VFLYRGWERVAARLSGAGAKVNIITNGFLLGDKQVEQIRRAGLVNVGISVDGMEASHDRTRNVPGSFRRVVSALDRLRRAEIPTAAVTSLLDYNFADLEPLHDLLAEHGVNVWQLQIATAMGNLARQEGLLLDPAKVPLVTRFIRRKREEQRMRIYAGDDIGYFDENEMYLRNRPGTICTWGGCQAGLSVVGIDSVGNVKGCESLYSDRFTEGNLRAESFAEIWHKEGAFAYNREFDESQLTGRCAGCDKGDRCRGGCRGSCYFTTGSLYDNPYCCYPGNGSSHS
jgi:radical SAM protein with 4Fe4S-binding SPASM domain